MRHLILVPHQDDEMLNCYSIMKLFGNECKVAVVFKGGGESKSTPYTAEELYKERCEETKEACSRLGVEEFDFLEIPRGTKEPDVFREVWEYLDREQTKDIFTSYPYDKHPEHMMLGRVVSMIKENAFGFVTQTQHLIAMRCYNSPDMFVKLSNKEYEEKKELIDIYQTQKHFLPNIVRRLAYSIETFWRLNSERNTDIS